MQYTYIKLDLWRDKVIIPTIIRWKFGAKYTEPVFMIGAEDRDGILDHIIGIMSSGNTFVTEEQLDADVSSYWIIACGIKSWPSYSKLISSWHFIERDRNYDIIEYKRVRGGGMVPDPDNQLNLPAGTNLRDACARLVDLVQARFNQRQ